MAELYDEKMVEKYKRINPVDIKVGNQMLFYCYALHKNYIEYVLKRVIIEGKNNTQSERTETEVQWNPVNTDSKEHAKVSMLTGVRIKQVNFRENA